MSKEFEFLNNIYRQKAGVAFNLICDVLMENGYANFKNATDEDIEAVECPNLIAEDMYKDILLTAREIAQNTSPHDLLQFAMVEPFLRLDLFKENTLNREELEKMVKASIQADLNGFDGNYSIMHIREPKDFKNANDIQYFCERYDCDADIFEKLGFEVSEDYAF